MQSKRICHTLVVALYRIGIDPFFFLSYNQTRKKEIIVCLCQDSSSLLCCIYYDRCSNMREKKEKDRELLVRQLTRKSSYNFIDSHERRNQ